MLEMVFADVLLNITPCFRIDRGYSALITSAGRVRCTFGEGSGAPTTVDWVLDSVALAELNAVAVCLAKTESPESFDDHCTIDGLIGQVEISYNDGRRLTFSANSAVASLCSDIIQLDDHYPGDLDETAE